MKKLVSTLAKKSIAIARILFSLVIATVAAINVSHLSSSILAVMVSSSITKLMHAFGNSTENQLIYASLANGFSTTAAAASLIAMTLTVASAFYTFKFVNTKLKARVDRKFN